MDVAARVLIVVGVVVVAAGLLLLLLAKVTGLGRLPGDLIFRWGDVTVAFPVVTMILLSIVLTVLLNVAVRLFR